VLWRVFCVYCKEKHRIPASPPITTVAPVLSPGAVERLTTGHSAHPDHHAHAAAVSHPYHDIRHHDGTHSHHKEPSQAQIKRDLYLHRDIYLHTDDVDATEVLLHKAHRHAANHPEEGIVVHHEPVKHDKPAPVHHHDAFRAHPQQHEVEGRALRKDLHLHHDVFLSTQDEDLAEVELKRSHPHAANHPEEGVTVHNGHIQRPPPIAIPSPLRPAQAGSTGTGESARASPMPPATPLYGLFTVIEDGDGEEDAQVPNKLTFASPDAAHGRHADGEAVRRVPRDMELQISHPHVSAPTDPVPLELVAAHASTRFRKHLLDVDGLWQLFQDFNVAPYLLWYGSSDAQSLIATCVS
jgi:hypothetical protein